MYDGYGDGWTANGRLGIRINSTTVDSYTATITSGYTNTFTFDVTSGDVVRFYWLVDTGTAYQYENSFIAYYTNTPPNPAFTTSNNNTWSGTNALVHRLRGTMGDITNGTLLGSFTVQ